MVHPDRFHTRHQSTRPPALSVERLQLGSHKMARERLWRSLWLGGSRFQYKNAVTGGRGARDGGVRFVTHSLDVYVVRDAFIAEVGNVNCPLLIQDAMNAATRSAR